MNRLAMSLLTFVIGLIFFSSCRNDVSTAPKKLFMCACEEIVDVNNTLTVSKLRYIYIVESVDSLNCCNAPVVDQYKGFVEVWENEAPKYPNVWGRSESDVKSMSAEEAMLAGCAFEKRVTAFYEIKDGARPVADYYPDLVELDPIN